MKVCHKSGWVSDKLVDANEEFQFFVVARSSDVAEVRRRHPAAVVELSDVALSPLPVSLNRLNDGLHSNGDSSSSEGLMTGSGSRAMTSYLPDGGSPRRKLEVVSTSQVLVPKVCE